MFEGPRRSLNSPHERYMAALAEAKEAQAEYLATLEREKAEQTQAREQLLAELDDYRASICHRPCSQQDVSGCFQQVALAGESAHHHPTIQRLTNEFSAVLSDLFGETRAKEQATPNHHQETVKLFLNGLTEALAAAHGEPKSQPAPISRSPSPHMDESGKGKGKKAVSFDVDAAKSASAQSIETIRNIETSFYSLKDDFVMPKEPDFGSPTTLPTSSFPTLTYTSNNAPLHNYMHGLSQLIAWLDTVESYGLDSVREKRREVVNLIEDELQDVQSEVDRMGRLSLDKVKAVRPADPVILGPRSVSPTPSPEPVIPLEPVPSRSRSTRTAATYGTRAWDPGHSSNFSNFNNFSHYSATDNGPDQRPSPPQPNPYRSLPYPTYAAQPRYSDPFMNFSTPSTLYPQTALPRPETAQFLRPILRPASSNGSPARASSQKCSNCAKRGIHCDEARPCSSCTSLGISQHCVNGQRGKGRRARGSGWRTVRSEGPWA